MNKDRRKAIAAAIELVEAAQAAAAEARDAIETIKDEETEYKDNMPESLQDGEKGQRADEVIDFLDTAFNDLDCIDFDAIIDGLNQAAE